MEDKIRKLISNLTDQIKGYILYIGALLSESEEKVVRYLIQLESLGINEVTRFIVDMCKSFPQAVHEVYPKAKIQYDYFQIWEPVNRHLDYAIKEYSGSSSVYRESLSLLKEYGPIDTFSLRHRKGYTEKNKETMNEIILSCKENLLANILVLKDRIGAHLRKDKQTRLTSIWIFLISVFLDADVAERHLHDLKPCRSDNVITADCRSHNKHCYLAKIFSKFYSAFALP